MLYLQMVESVVTVVASGKHKSFSRTTSQSLSSVSRRDRQSFQLEKTIAESIKDAEERAVAESRTDAA